MDNILRGCSIVGIDWISGSRPRLRNSGTRPCSSVKPMKKSTSGISLVSSVLYLCTRHPTATTALKCPRDFRSQASKIVSRDCSLESCMKPQVFTIKMSASRTSDDTLAPWPTKEAIIRSESTVFLSQPSVTSAMCGPSGLPTASNSCLTGATSGFTSGLTGSGTSGNTGRSLVRILGLDSLNQRSHARPRAA